MRAVPAFVLLCLLCLLAARAHAQAPAPVPDAWAWRVVVDGTSEPLTVERALPPDSVAVVGRALLTDLHGQGYLFARVDSARVDSSAVPPTVDVFVRPGPEVEVGRVRILGAGVLDSVALRRGLDTRPGRPFRHGVLEADIRALLDRYDRAGHGLVRVRRPEVRLVPGEPPRIDVTLRVEEGPALVLQGVEVPDGVRTRPAYVARLLGLRPGRPLEGFNAVAAARLLEEEGHYEQVAVPTLRVEGDSAAVLVLDVEERPPGAFDLVFGYQPSTSGGGSVVGNGHLLLQNLFGAGRTFSARLDRLPGQVSSAEVRVADPFVFGSPFGAELRFEGLQQDTTFTKLAYGAEASVRLAGGVSVFATLTREGTRPGFSSAQAGRQAVPRSDAFFTGLGLRYRRVDRLVNPRRGLVFQTNYERGRKTADPRGDGGADVLRQGRLTATARGYVPTFTRQLVAVGAEARVLTSPRYDEADLFRLGGATTLRGYNEDRFRGRIVGRALAEYRFQLDRTSYAFAFADLGYVQAPPLEGQEPDRDNGLHPGYGLGLQFSTNLGLVSVSYAVGQERSPTSGRVHVGLSFGL